MHPQASTAERAIPQPPFAETQEMIAYFRAQGETSVIQNHGLPNTVSPTQPSLLSAEESPFGVPVRLAINSQAEQTNDSFYVVDIRHATAMRGRDGQVRRILSNGMTVTTSPRATHLLINRHFGDSESTPGYAELGPGQSIDIARQSKDEETSRTMMYRFGIYPVVTSPWSRERHARVSLGEDGKSISVLDTGSKLGTFITTRKPAEAQAVPDRASRGHRVARVLRKVVGDGGAQYTNGYGQER